MILTGTYRNFVPVSNTTYTGSATFVGVIQLGNLSNVTFDGNFTLSGCTISPNQGNNINIHFNGFDLGNGNVVIDGSGGQITYKGTPQTTLFTNLAITNFKFSGNTIYGGTWDAPSTFHNVNIGMILSGGTITNSSGTTTTKVFGNSIYQYLFDSNHVSGPNLYPQVDSGVFQIQSGNGIVRNNKRIGGFGYLLRQWTVSLGVQQDSYFYNNIDYGTNSYGTIDTRIDTGLLPSGTTIPLLGGDFYCYFNTSGDKTDDGSYVTPLIVVGSYQGHKVVIENNFAFNAMINGMSNNTSILKDNSGGIGTISLSNNVDVVGQLPSGYIIDKTGFQPVISGPLYQKAIAIQSITTDIYGTSRPAIPDTGAVQSLPEVIPPKVTITSVVVKYSDGTSKTIQ